MTSGFVLIAAILILGGVIATAGDRIGMRVGKARLSLFDLRPRQTATLITILTGGVISASTLGLLFAISEQLRTGVFELKEIQDERDAANTDLSQTRRNLRRTRQQKSRVEQELSEAQDQRQEAQDRLLSINRSLQAAVDQQAQTEQQLEETRAALGQTQANFQQAQQQLQQVTQQSSELRGEVDLLQQERETLIARQRDRETLIAQLDQDLAQRERQLQTLERQQKVLERQRAALVQDVQALEREIQALREGDVALFTNQVLAAGVLQVDSPAEAQQAIDQVLRQANQAVFQTILPSVGPLEAQVIKIKSADVAEVVRRISDGQAYVIQILSGGNYLIGEPCVISGQTCIDVAANAVPNELVFREGDIITSVTIAPAQTSNSQLLERLEVLIAASQLRARQAGVLPRTVEISAGAYGNLRRFLGELQDLPQAPTDSFVVQAIAATDIYTVGPLALEFVVLQDGQPVFSDGSSDGNGEP